MEDATEIKVFKFPKRQMSRILHADEICMGANVKPVRFIIPTVITLCLRKQIHSQGER